MNNENNLINYIGTNERKIIDECVKGYDFVHDIILIQIVIHRIYLNHHI